MSQPGMKFCKHCGAQIPTAAVICTHCGCQVEEMHQQPVAQPNIVINNANTNVNHNTAVAGGYYGKPRRALSKWVSLLLCVFLGYFGAHKFYEGKIGMGVVYLCTVGLFGFGWLIDCVLLLLKPNPYYV